MRRFVDAPRLSAPGALVPCLGAIDWSVEVELSTACKHRRGYCERCGTSDARGEVHTTRGGLGCVGRLRENK